MKPKYMTTEQLMQAARRTVQQMSPEEKTELRKLLDQQLKEETSTLEPAKADQKKPATGWVN